MPRFSSSTESRLLGWALKLSFAVITAILLANLAALLFAVPEVVSLIGSLLGSGLSAFAQRARSLYPFLQVSNIAICLLGMFIVVLLQRTMIVLHPRKMVSVENAVRVATIASALLVIEIIGSVTRFVIFGDKLTYLKIVNYAGIGCVFILAYILFRAANTRDSDGVV